MLIKKSQIPILVTNVVALMIFVVIFLSRENYEFLIYVGVIIFFLLLILFTNKKVDYPNDLLWGLTVWSLLHMIGGGIFIGGKKVYELMLWPIVGEPYNIFKYDQLIHAIGFGIATLLMYHLLKPSLQKKKSWISLSIVIVMAGLGAGALNEIIEFMAKVLMPETGVGGYENTALDLVSNLIGAIVAMIYIKKTNK
jgi:uncharacterized membrane protein YjdF